MSAGFPIAADDRVRTFTVSSGQTVFGPFSFKIFDDEDVVLETRATVDDPWTVVSSGVTVTLTGAAPATFTVTKAGLATGLLGRVKGLRVPTREDNATRAGSISSTKLENDLDKLTIIAQETRRDSSAAEVNASEAKALASQAFEQVDELVEGLIPEQSVTNDRLADMPEARVIGRPVGAATGAPQYLTPEQLRAMASVNEFIFTNVTKTFGPGGDFTAWSAFKTWLADKRIAFFATVTLSVLAGTHAATASDYLQISHPDGPRIKVIGAGSGSTTIEVQRAPSADVWGCEIVNGSGLGRIDDLTIRGNGWGGSQGLWANDGTGNGRRCWGVGGFNNTGSVVVGDGCIIERVYVGVRGEGAGCDIRVEAGTTIRDCGDASVLARGACRIVARGVIARGPGDADFNLGHNFIAEDNAYLDCVGAISTFAPAYGGHCSVQGGGTMDAREILIGFNADGSASTGGGIGIRTLGGNGVIDAKGAVIRDCFGNVQALNGGVIEAAGILSFDHTSGGFHFEAKSGGQIKFGFYLPLDYPNRQGSPVSALATRTMRTSAGATENTVDLSVFAGGYTNENDDTNGLARQSGSITVVSTAYSPAGGGRAKAIFVDRNAFNGGLIPVAPQPITTSGALGEWRTLEAFAASSVNLPSGGTWAYFAVGMNSSSNLIDHKTGIGAGGATITMSGSVTTIRGVCWKVT